MSHDGDLPWYLRETLGSDDGDEKAKFVRYVGNFEDRKDIPTNFLSEGTYAHSNVNNAKMIGEDGPQLPRRRPTRHKEEYESDPYFNPFTGTLEDLIKSAKIIEDKATSDIWSGEIIEIRCSWWCINTAIMIISFLFFIAQKQLRATKTRGHSVMGTSTGSRLVVETDERHEKKNKLGSNKASDGNKTDPPDVANFDFQTVSTLHERDKSIDLREENTGSELCDEPVENTGDHEQKKVDTTVTCDKNIGEELTSFLTKGGNAPSCVDEFSDMIQKGIPAMAELLSKSGLNSQDSLRIATQEYLTTRRRDMEVRISWSLRHFSFAVFYSLYVTIRNNHTNLDSSRA